MNISEHPLLSIRFYRTIMDQASDAILIMNLKWQLLEANQPALHELAYQQEEIKKLNFSQIESGFSAEKADEYIAQLNRSETPRFQGEKIRKDGTKFHSASRLSLIRDQNTAVLLVFFQNTPPPAPRKMVLEDNQIQVDKLIEHFPDSIYFKDRECRLIRVNKKMIRDLGVSGQEALLGKTDVEVFGAQFGQKTLLEDQEIIRTGTPVIGLVESRNLPDGSLNWTLTTKVPLLGEAGEVIGIAGITKEINDLKKQEGVLRLKEYQLSMASEIADLGYWEYDIIKDEYTFNDHFYKVYRTSADEMGGYHMNAEQFSERFLHPDDMDLINSEIQLAIDTDDPNFSRHLEHRIQYLNGETGYVSVNFFVVKDKNGRTVKSYGANQIITDRKRAELAIKEKEGALQKAFEISAIGPYRYNIMLDEYEWSDRAIQVIGFPSDQVPLNFESFLALMPPDDQQLLLQKIKIAARTGQLDIEHRIHINGAVKWLRFISHQENDEQGQPLNSIGIVKDITVRKLAEMKLADNQEQLERLVKERTFQLENTNKELEAFAYSISHDLRAPLRHINGFANILKRKLGEAPDNVREYIELITESSKRMGTMIDGLLDFSRLGRKNPKKASVDLNKIVREVIQNFKPDTEHRKISWNIHPLPVIQGDPELLKIVFENLISNAIKYTQTTPDAVIEINSLPTHEQNCCIYIKDNGVGFDMNYADKLFGVFQRLHNDEEFEGTGIGLAHAQQIVKKHGGDIRATGTPGLGATFYVTL